MQARAANEKRLSKNQYLAWLNHKDFFQHQINS